MAAEMDRIIVNDEHIPNTMSDSAFGSIDVNSESSSNTSGNSYFFEGAEKLLEVWFKSENDFDLQQILPEEIWTSQILPEVRCEIMSCKKDNFQTAYVLSESSLFVTKNKYILKTCGRTKCLSSLPLVLEILKNQNIEVDRVFYSRKNFTKPEEQPEIYASEYFKREREFLDNILKSKTNKCKSKAFCLGELSANKWFLYQAEAEKNDNSAGKNNISPDQTLEILMLNLNPSTMKSHFFSNPHVTKDLKLNRIIPNTVTHDEHIFQPCGYSSNSLIDAEIFKSGYTTIHVTPEESFSYASFETNVVSKDMENAIIEKVLDIFRPDEYILTIVATKNSECYPFVRRMIESDENVQFCNFGDYNVVYKHFIR